MKTTKVEYTVKQGFVHKNEENIKKVMHDLRELNHPGIRYSTYLKDDGKSFVHFAQFDNDAANQALAQLPSFKQFQSELKESGLEVPPKAEVLTMVASSYDIFFAK